MEFYYGQINLYAFNFAPQGWILCDGRSLDMNAFSELFSLIGLTYGGNGIDTFEIPNMLGMEPIPYMKYYIAVEGTYPNRS